MNVYDAAKDRIALIFKEFDNIYVSFSGGKDSGVLLNLCIDHIRENRLNRKIGVFHLDYEAQYQMTTDYVLDTLSQNKDILDVYHCCVPIKVTTCTSMHQSYWRPWDTEKKDIWVRSKPKGCYSEFEFLKPTMWDYEFQEKIGAWLHSKNNAKRTCCMIGIRTQESLNRWRAIYSDKNYKNFRGINWTKDMENGVINAYPVHDWTTEDIWIGNAKLGWSYNRLYDLFHKAGLTIHQMRVASPFICEGQGALKLYRVIDPNNWAKLIGRVNGVNFTGIYGGTSAMGWRSLSCPTGHTWKSYMFFLLATLPEEIKQNYLSKLETSVKFWQEKGGCLAEDTIKELRDAGVEITVESATNYKTTKKPVRMEYLDDINIANFKDIPTYKRMCICIMKNDHLCKYMGFSQTKNEIIRRQNIIEKYQSLL